eukprot:8180932-Pyramimonas_sp.AAC.1
MIGSVSSCSSRSSSGIGNNKNSGCIRGSNTDSSSRGSSNSRCRSSGSRRSCCNNELCIAPCVAITIVIAVVPHVADVSHRPQYPSQLSSASVPCPTPSPLRSHTPPARARPVRSTPSATVLAHFADIFKPLARVRWGRGRDSMLGCRAARGRGQRVGGRGV